MSQAPTRLSCMDTGDRQRAVEIICKMARWNRRATADVCMCAERMMQSEETKPEASRNVRTFTRVQKIDNPAAVDTKGNNNRYAMLFVNRHATRNTCVLLLMWFSVALCSYALSLNIGTLPGDAAWTTLAVGCALRHVHEHTHACAVQWH